MGEKVIQFHVQSNASEDVARVLQSIIRTEAYVSPPHNGWITIYDEMSEYNTHLEEIIYIARELSSQLSTFSLIFLVLRGIHFFYFMFEQGILADQFYDRMYEYRNDLYEFPIELDPFSFNSVDEVNEGFQGRPDILLRACSVETPVEQITALLQELKQEYSDYLGDGPYLLAPLLGIDQNRASITGFIDFEADNLQSSYSILEDAEDFIHVVRGQSE